MRVILLALLLTGCASPRSAVYENRIAGTVAKDEAFYVSLYGQIGVASKISDKDVKILCSAP